MSVIYTRELLEPIIESSNSWAEVCRKLKIKPATGSQSHLTSKAKLMLIDYSHFTGKAWHKGKKLGFKKPIAEYLVISTKTYSKSDWLKKRLIKEGIKEHKCERCGLTEWLGQPTPLELDHINRNHYDNRLENLMILCPNCHSQKTNEDRQAEVV